MLEVKIRIKWNKRNKLILFHAHLNLILLYNFFYPLFQTSDDIFFILLSESFFYSTLKLLYILYK